MISKRSKLFYFCLAIVLICSGCVNKSTSNASPHQVLAPKNDILSIFQFQQLAASIEKNLIIPGFKINGSTLGDNTIIAVEKELSFDKRSYLTTNGIETGQKTQERITFNNDRDHYLVFLDVIYLNNYIGNDLVYWKLADEKFKEEKTYSRFKDSIISYKNIIVKTTIVSQNEELDSLKLIEVDNSIVNFLKGYQS
ncbi:hypothetical protein [Paenibacillus sp. UMB4589-SE434]|uniref:hypothetical protein n=1 Tax=Paenibacillus sp. UMB4589-SE434 TaxID=3046314 RepID=UPI00254BBAB7|nr:hypothetical protein [Paenibacillus sp. UMB4589-SE434]MDK8183668.1 hypothetical protein [Paenibacillus sp. UMB4589-SE434]